MMIAAAFSCLFLGDSIDVGAAAAVRARYAVTCDVATREGVSAVTVASWPPIVKAYDTAIVSLGSNIPDDPRLAERIAGIRTVLRARRVIWLLPYHRGAAAIVTRIAIRFRDDRLDLAAIATRDGVHPDYRALADALVD